MAKKKVKQQTSEEGRALGVDPDHEALGRDEVVDDPDQEHIGSTDVFVAGSPSELQNPYVGEEEQNVQMAPETLGDPLRP